MDLDSPLEYVKGVGPKTAAQLADANLFSVRDMINFLPRSFEDFSNFTTLTDIRPGKISVCARCEKVETRSVRRGMKITTATLADGHEKIQAVWFNQPYREAQIKDGQEYIFSGTYEFSYNKYQLMNARVEKAHDVKIEKPSADFLAIYPARKGLKTQVVRDILKEIRPLFSQISETVPSEIIKKNRLVSRATAFESIHFAKDETEYKSARNRLAFDELFGLFLASARNKKEQEKLRGYRIAFDQEIVQDFVKNLPFELTNAQRLAAWQILQDFAKKTPMNRLLQGDVGSGKTVVAAIAAVLAARRGYQTAMMAPTEILATQHAENLQKLCAPLGISVGLLTGSVKNQARKNLYEHIADGTVSIVIGTHALFQDTVSFHKLGFVAIDEQHRFGVAQRQKLLEKSAKMPHLLAMTATPIPRSLTLALYGELEISILAEKPKNRKDIITKIWSPISREQLYERIENELDKGRQVYVICPLIGESKNSEDDKKSVEEEYKKLRTGIFKHRKIGLLHGKLKSEEKERIMREFAAHESDILVSTTVVEVGVDIPNATVMLIENADNFGLSQLHQLRGRVGRSDQQSYCYLMLSDTKKPSKRLQEIETSNDGFHLAEIDLELRGPGEIYGKMQHGALNLQIATLADTKLMAQAQEAAKWFIEKEANLLEYKELANSVEQYQRITTLN